MVAVGGVAQAAGRWHPTTRWRDPAARCRRRQFTLPSAAIWRVNDMAAKQAALLAGLGWGRLPRHLAEPEIAAGRLVPLAVEAIESLDWSIPLPLHVAYRKNDALGSAASWMRDALVAAA
ncbi:LysR substrate-binding domain-containing protein [Teichococcus deserti]|uniref:LysR substrate-binding domain-containing protein n=1 Tax=Teichococcus deserti TaxID=1817963 RepID=UPI0024185709|nr:LysR substrate-binding domain-containing protein [Pseudoroseomonas deserti]